jgi:hypothetical protein
MRTLEVNPMTEPTGPSFSSRLPSPNPIRLAIVAGVVIVLALSAVVTMAASPSPQGSATGPATPAGPNTPAGSPAPGHRGPSSGFGGFGRGSAGPNGGGFAFGGGFGGFGAFGGVTVASIDGSNLALKTADGWTRTISITSSTKITRGGQSISLSDLNVGDSIGFRESKASDGSYTITAINVILPRVFGQVTATTASTIAIKQFDGTTATIDVGSSTTFRIFGVSGATIASLKVGMAISAEGTKNADGSLEALNVTGGRIRVPFPGGGNRAPGGNKAPGGPAQSGLPGA